MTKKEVEDIVWGVVSQISWAIFAAIILGILLHKIFY